METMQAVRKVAGKEQGTSNCAKCPCLKWAADEVLMKVYAAGIRGAYLLIEEDRHFYRAPVTQGDEFSVSPTR